MVSGLRERISGFVIWFHHPSERSPVIINLLSGISDMYPGPMNSQKKMLVFVIFLLLVALVYQGIRVSPFTASDRDPGSSFDISGMNRTVSPGVDFYLYANGNDITENPVPPDMSRYTIKDRLMEENDNRILDIVLDCVGNTSAKRDSPERKIRDFYLAGMDEESINRAGITPIQPWLNRIEGIKTPDDVISISTLFMANGVPTLFSYYADPDPDNRSVFKGTISQDGIGLPVRDYYLRYERPYVAILREYRAYIVDIFRAAGYSSEKAEYAADTVMRIETGCAKVSSSRDENRDQNRTRLSFDRDGLMRLAPGINWTLFFQEAGTPNAGSIHVIQPGYVSGISTLLHEEPVSSWRIYLTWRLLSHSAWYLDDTFHDAAFRFYDQNLSGVKEEKPRWRQVIEVQNGLLGWVIAPLYLSRYFPESSKIKVSNLVLHLKSAFHNRIDNLTWMDESTKQRAHAKLERMRIGVGYPDLMPDYSGVMVTNGSYVTNIMSAERYWYYHGPSGISRIGESTEPGSWYMTPQTVDAYNNLQTNEIVFPAGLLESPIFYAGGDDAINYGAAGMAIGHEMIHGFDDMGRQFGADGSLDDWWTPADEERYAARARNVSSFFGRYEVLPGLNINGNFTLDESIADLGGVHLAFDAYRESLDGREPCSYDGLTGYQRFFLGFARVWSSSVREEELANQVLNDPHPPGRYRVNGVVYNMDEFYEAFSEVNETSPGYIPPEKRFSVW